MHNINRVLAFFRPHFRAVSVTKNKTISILPINGNYTAKWLFSSKAGNTLYAYPGETALLMVFLEPPSRIRHRPYLNPLPRGPCVHPHSHTLVTIIYGYSFGFQSTTVTSSLKTKLFTWLRSNNSWNGWQGSFLSPLFSCPSQKWSHKF